MRKYIPHIQPIPLPLPLQPLDTQSNTEEVIDTSITFKPFFYNWPETQKSYYITNYHFDLTDKNEYNNNYFKLDFNNFPQWFLIKDNLNLLQDTFIINIDEKTVHYNQKLIQFLDISTLSTQQILLLQKVYYYATQKQNVSLNRENFTESFRLFIPNIMIYPIAHQLTPQYKLIQEWHKITENEKNKQIGQHIINQAVHFPTWWKMLNYSFYQHFTYFQIAFLILITHISYIIFNIELAKNFILKHSIIFFLLLILLNKLAPSPSVCAFPSTFTFSIKEVKYKTIKNK